MGFKSLTNYVEEKQGNYFTLANNGDKARVIFLYQSVNDVLVADAHYISSKTYSGYAHCLGDNCPACNYPTQSGRGIRKDTTVFIPLYNIDKNKVEFWQRTPKFVNQVMTQSVFKNFPNPSEFVFEITRNGEAGDPGTRYAIKATNKNSNYPYAQILADFGLIFPQSYELVCKDMSYEEMNNCLTADTPSDLPDYGFQPIPRGNSAASSEAAFTEMPELNVETPNYGAVPTTIPSVDDELPFGDPVAPASTSGNGGDGGSDSDIDNPVF